MSACMLISHKGHADTIQVYSVTVMTHVKALQAGHSSQGTSEPITPDSEAGLPKPDSDPAPDSLGIGLSPNSSPNTRSYSLNQSVHY